jgi:hypothetical protein
MMKSALLSSVKLTAIVVACALMGSATAQTLPKEGNFDVTGCSSSVANVISFSPNHTASSWELTGSNLSNPPGGLLDKLSFRCVGMNWRQGEKTFASYVCEGVVPEGSKLLSYWRAEDGKVTRLANIGTGMFEGIELTTNVEPLGPFPQIKPGTSQNCSRNTGTYKLK